MIEETGMRTRQDRLLATLSEKGLDGVVVQDKRNVYYLTGFLGTSGMVYISLDNRLFLTDARYTSMAKEVVSGFTIVETREPLAVVASMMTQKGLRIGFEDTIRYQAYQAMTAHLVGHDLVAMSQEIESLRMIKDATEIALIETACQIGDKAFLDLLDWIKPGVTEADVAQFLDFRMRQYGASGVSFDPIVASGYRSSMPHGRATDKVIAEGDAVTLDFGCYYKVYASDMTRTIYMGTPSDEEALIYQSVLAANEALIVAARSGLSCQEVDSIPRGVIEQAGYGPYFSHGIGHGLGLDVHETPYFGSGKEGSIAANMVITDEPGIYLPDTYGVRIEDVLVIEDEGCRVLTHAPKELIVING